LRRSSPKKPRPATSSSGLGAGDITTWAYALPEQLVAVEGMTQIAKRPSSLGGEGGPKGRMRGRAGDCGGVSTTAAEGPARPSSVRFAATFSPKGRRPHFTHPRYDLARPPSPRPRQAPARRAPRPVHLAAGRRAGGLLFLPADADDLGAAPARAAADIPVTALGVGSNLIVRDGAWRGGDSAWRAAASPRSRDAETATVTARRRLDAPSPGAGQAGIAGLEFYSGVPGTIGGALTMNAAATGL